MAQGNSHGLKIKHGLSFTLIYLYKPTTYKSGVVFNEYKYCKPLYLYEH